MKSGTIIRQVLNKINEIDFNNSEDRHLWEIFMKTILKELQSAGNSGEFYTPRAITQFITQMIDPKLNEITFRSCLWNWWILVNTIDHIKSNGKLKLQKINITAKY